MRCANGIKLGNIANTKSEYHVAGKKSEKCDCRNRNRMEEFKVIRN